MLFTVIVSLYTSRVVLQVLGAFDYGLYNVIGGILTMFGMFSAALTVGTQRFQTYDIGEGDKEKLKRTFSMSVTLHVCLSAIILILSETIGLWFLYEVMNIPQGRINAAFWVYQFTILGFIVSLIQVPFQSALIAHERMNMYAYMSIYDVSMKLLLVILLQYISFDKLILYAVMIFAVNTTSVLIYNYYSQRHFEECRFHFAWDRKLAKEMASYSGWNVIGGAIGVSQNQAINILLNIFCGTVVNAARGISMQVNSFVTMFVNNFQTAVNPQIVKQYAAKEYESLYRLVVNNCRIAAYLYMLVAIPLFWEIDFVLQLWLGQYPEYTAIFVRIILLQSLASPLNSPIGMLIHASGKMRKPVIWAALVIVIVSLSYALLKM